MSESEKYLSRLKVLDANIIRLNNIGDLLEWDQETHMPTNARNERAAQLALLAALRQERIIDPEWETLLEKLGYSMHPDTPIRDSVGSLNPPVTAADATQSTHTEFNEVDRAFLREVHRRWVRNKALPRELVEAIASEGSLAQTAWVDACKTNDFSAFAPHLAKIIELKREYALTIAPDTEPYDTLLDEYEPGVSSTRIAAIFDELSAGLQILLDGIRGAADGVDSPTPAFLNRKYSVEKQDAFGRRIQSHMGFDTSRGRLDLSVHPFSITLGPNDIRLTTRYKENEVLSGLFSNIHEAGHGLYEQGMDENLWQTILEDGASLGIHESQSKFWESIVGKSHAFWSFWYTEFQKLFPENLADVKLGDFYHAINIVRPSLIRVDADEVTYSLHIVIRFRLEQALISGNLDASDLPDAWNQAYRELLGITPNNDVEGCMQDIHWSAGQFGYFPTYTLGNLYSAQFIRPMEEAVGPLADILEKGEFNVILRWLKENIHRHGRVHRPAELCHRLSGKYLDSSDFLDYLNSKYRRIYRF